MKEFVEYVVKALVDYPDEVNVREVDGERTVVFEGTARAAALGFPKNANLAAAVALAGLGFDATTVQLVADPAATGNTGQIDAEGAASRLQVVVSGAASTANPKTYAMAEDNIDFYSGTVIVNKEDPEKAGERLYRTVIDIASGTLSRSETLLYSDPVDLYLEEPRF